MEKPVAFQNMEGFYLYGIVHIPDNPDKLKQRVGINLLNPGLKTRVAPHRLNVKIARKLCQLGFYVLRFDPHGIGDSEGELGEGKPIHALWRDIQDGLFVSDTLSANRFFTENFGIDSLYMAGSCGGAITSLLCAARDKRIEGLCLIDIPIFLGSSNITYADLVVPHGKKHNWLLGEYKKKVFSLSAWVRLLTFKTDYSTLYKILKPKLQKFLSVGRKIQQPEYARLCAEGKLNKRFFDSIEKILDDPMPILFVIAENDHGTELFLLHFKEGYLDEKYNGNTPEAIKILSVKNANHIYSSIESQNTLIQQITLWFSQKSQIIGI